MTKARRIKPSATPIVRGLTLRHHSEAWLELTCRLRKGAPTELSICERGGNETQQTRLRLVLHACRTILPVLCLLVADCRYRSETVARPIAGVCAILQLCHVERLRQEVQNVSCAKMTEGGQCTKTSSTATSALCCGEACKAYSHSHQIK